MAKKPIRRIAITDEATKPDPVVPQGAQTTKLAEVLASEEQILVTVPKAFPFTRDDHSIVQVRVGVQKMPASMARHWFVKAQGVAIFEE